MRAMTWNVWWRFGGAWRDRERRIAATVRRVRPDVLGLTEAWAGEGTTQMDRLAFADGMATAFAPTSLPPLPDPPEEPSQAGIAMGVGVLSRWPILATEVHELPHPQRPGPPPTALLTTLAHPRGPLHFIVACLEWESRYAGDHLAQARALADLVADPRLDGDQPVLVTGDFNASAEASELAPLLAVATDAWPAGGGDPGAVTLSSAVPQAPLAAAKQIDRRIDHILARPGRPGAPLTVRSAFLAGEEPIEGRYPSDHFAVVADLDW